CRPVADLLHRRHERQREQRGPQQAVLEFRARLRVGRNAGWVVIGRARDQTGTNVAYEAEPSVRFGSHGCGDTRPPRAANDNVSAARASGLHGLTRERGRGVDRVMVSGPAHPVVAMPTSAANTRATPQCHLSCGSNRECRRIAEVTRFVVWRLATFSRTS